MKLKDCLPPEFFQSFYNTRAASLLEEDVIKEYSLMDMKSWRSWPGIHKNVMNWWLLESGRMVGWNENSGTGWSFPVHGKRKN